jgi:hypothetical protein
MNFVRTELLFRNKHLTIAYNSIDEWLYVNWRGYQNYDTVVTGCEKLLEVMKETACYRVLNNNTNLEGQWSTASKWGGEVWFPAMRAAGLQWFAWIYSPILFSRLSADKMLHCTQNPDFIHFFDDLDMAKDWLRSKI